MLHRSRTNPLVEAMGLRLEDRPLARPLDALIDLALLLSGAVWVWAAVAGAGPTLGELFSSRVGRLAAGLLGIATVVAVARSLRRRAAF
jgi:hypothetical protein